MESGSLATIDREALLFAAPSLLIAGALLIKIRSTSECAGE